MAELNDTEPIAAPTSTRSASAPSGRFSPPRRRPAMGRGVLGSPPPSAVPSGALTVATKRRRSFVRELTKWVVSLLILVLLAPPLLAASLLAAVYWQARTDEVRPVEAIVVLGAAQYNGRPSAVLRARLERTAEVYWAGYAPLVVVTGGKEPDDAFTEAEASRDYLVERGVPETAILLENEGRDSWSSMQGVARLLERRGLTKVLLVSDGFHLLRVKIMARDLGLTAYAAIAGESPIRPWSGSEFAYTLREVAGIGVHWWQQR